MITEIKLKNFKHFSKTSIKLNDRALTILAGGNNSGKSSVLQALAVWEFCKMHLSMEKGVHSLHQGFSGAGLGINLEDFSPINIPRLSYLWTNLKPSASYSLSISCKWIHEGVEKSLEIGLALANDRLFMKPLFSNVQPNDKIPNVAYLPPFAGISEKESWYSPADRRRLIGRGLSGAILRNTIHELYSANIRKRIDAKGDRTKIPKQALEDIRMNDPFEILNYTIHSTFGAWLIPLHFDPTFHSYVKVEIAKGSLNRKRFVRHKGYNPRDIMVEGSGFLQWLSVYTTALNPEIDVILLDEPDAHLHPSLQMDLTSKLDEISNKYGKQVLMASHSTEIIKNINHSQILEIKERKGKYLDVETKKTALLVGLGTEYSPVIHRTQAHARIIFVENNSDIDFLRKWAEKLNLVWPRNIVPWCFANNHKERKQLFHHLKDEIQGLKCISLEDRDNYLYENVSENLEDSFQGISVNGAEFIPRRWRRWEIENYLFNLRALSRAANKTEEEIGAFVQENFSIILPDDTRSSERTLLNQVVFELRGKEIIDVICNHYNISKFDIADSMLEEEVPDDIRKLLTEIIEMCRA